MNDVPLRSVDGVALLILSCHETSTDGVCVGDCDVHEKMKETHVPPVVPEMPSRISMGGDQLVRSIDTEKDEA